jgi:hypothetical protein
MPNLIKKSVTVSILDIAMQEWSTHPSTFILKAIAKVLSEVAFSREM